MPHLPAAAWPDAAAQPDGTAVPQVSCLGLHGPCHVARRRLPSLAHPGTVTLRLWRSQARQNLRSRLHLSFLLAEQLWNCPLTLIHSLNVAPHRSPAPACIARDGDQTDQIENIPACGVWVAGAPLGGPPAVAGVVLNQLVGNSSALGSCGGNALFQTIDQARLCRISPHLLPFRNPVVLQTVL